MHELGTIIYVINTVEQICREQELSVVGSVTLEVGEVSGIIPKYLIDYWDYAVKKSDFLKEAKLKIENLPAITFCQNCKQTYETVKYGKQCPHCESWSTFLITGNEYNIKEIEAM